MVDHQTEEFSKMKVIFHESRDEFIKMYNVLHKDFSDRVSAMAY